MGYGKSLSDPPVRSRAPVWLLKTRRERLGWSQPEMARGSGIGVQTIRAIEQGSTRTWRSSRGRGGREWWERPWRSWRRSRRGDKLLRERFIEGDGDGEGEDGGGKRRNDQWGS